MASNDSLPEVGLKGVFEIAEFLANQQRYIDATQQVDQANQQTSQSSQEAGRGLDFFGGIIQGVGQKIGQFILDQGTKLIDTLGSFVPLAGEDEASFTRLGAAVTASGADWGVAQGAIESYLVAARERIGLDDGPGRQALQRLTETTGDYNSALALLPIALDLAAAKQMDEATAAMMVGRVAQGNTTMLRRYGIILDENATSTEALAELQKRFGGQSEAMAQTYQGSMRRMQSAGDEAKESLGGIFLEWRTNANNFTADLINRVIPAIDGFASQVGPAIAGGMGAIGNAVMGIGQVLGIGVQSWGDTAEAGGLALGQQFANGIAAALPYIIGVIQAIGDIIAYWFAPGSPPRVAQDIDTWGQNLVQQYMAAFTDADFSVVLRWGQELSDTLKNAIAAGAITEDAAGAMLPGLQEAFAGAMSEKKQTGKVSEASYNAIQAAGGGAGTQVVAAARGLLSPDEAATAKAQEKAAEDAATQAAKLADDQARAASAAADAQERLALSFMSTSEKIDYYMTKLGTLTQGSADYYDMIYTIAQLQKQQAEDAQREQDAVASDAERAAREQEQAAQALASAQEAAYLQTASAADKVTYFQKKLSGLKDNTVEYYQAVMDLTSAQQDLAREEDKVAKAGGGGGGAAGGKGDAEAKALADAQERSTLASLDAAGTVDYYTKKLAGLQEGSKEYFDTLTDLTNAQKKLSDEQAKAGGAAGKGPADLADLIAKSTTGAGGAKKPEPFKLNMGDIMGQAQQIRHDIETTLFPIFDNVVKAWNKGYKAVTDVLQGIGTWWNANGKPVWQSIQNEIGNVWNWFMGKPTQDDWLIRTLSNIKKTWDTDVYPIFVAVGKEAGNLWDYFMGKPYQENWLTTLLTKVYDWGQTNIVPFLQGVETEVNNLFAYTMGQPFVDNWFTGLLDRIDAWAMGTGASTLSTILAGLTDIWNWLVTGSATGDETLPPFMQGRAGGQKTVEWADSVIEQLTRVQLWVQENWPVINTIISGQTLTMQQLTDTSLGAMLLSWSNTLTGIWLAVTTWWTNITTTFTTAWATLTTTVQTGWQTISEIYTNVTGAISAFFAPWLAMLAQWWTDHGANLVLIITTWWSAIEMAFNYYLAGLSKGVDAFWETVKTAWRVSTAVIGTELGVWFIAIKKLWSFLDIDLNKIVEGMWEGLKAIFKLALDIIGGLVDVWADLLTGKWTKIGTDLTTAWTRIWEDVKKLWAGYMDTLVGIFGSLYDRLKNAFLTWGDKLTTLGGDIIGGIVTGMENHAGDVIRSFGKIIGDAVDAILRSLGIGSPSRVMADTIGRPMAEGVAMGILQGAGSIQGAMAQALSSAAWTGTTPYMGLAGAGAGGGAQATVNISGVNITNGMDAALFDARVEEAVKRGIGG